VVIIGPGEVGDKMDALLREQLRGWLEQNPQLGLKGGKWLEQRIPRLPVVFVTKLSERSAKAMVASLAALGFVAEATAGGGFRHPLVRAKATKLAGRVAVIGLTSMGGLYSNGVWTVGVLVVGMLGALVGTTVHSARSVTRSTGRGPDALGPDLRGAFEHVEALVPTLDEPRHRHALRAVIRQVLALRNRIGPGQDEELAIALTRATATTGTLARIDRELREVDLNRADDNTRALLHQRDLWSGRMLELSGALEALRARATASQLPAAHNQLGDGDDALQELRERVEALEEVQRL
jgi:hypothetical protein